MTDLLTTGIVEDEDEVRQGLSFLLNNAPEIVCKHVYGSVEAAMANIGNDLPQVVLLDIGLPGADGIEGVRLLRARHPSLAIIILTVFRDEGRVFRATCAGALRAPSEDQRAGTDLGRHSRSRGRRRRHVARDCRPCARFIP
jgi:DNA-binding NarL/FixJ family response regulator